MGSVTFVSCTVLVWRNFSFETSHSPFCYAIIGKPLKTFLTENHFFSLFYCYVVVFECDLTNFFMNFPGLVMMANFWLFLLFGITCVNANFQDFSMDPPNEISQKFKNLSISQNDITRTGKKTDDLDKSELKAIGRGLLEAKDNAGDKLIECIHVRIFRFDTFLHSWVLIWLHACICHVCVAQPLSITFMNWTKTVHKFLQGKNHVRNILLL